MGILSWVGNGMKEGNVKEKTATPTLFKKFSDNAVKLTERAGELLEVRAELHSPFHQRCAIGGAGTRMAAPGGDAGQSMLQDSVRVSCLRAGLRARGSGGLKIQSYITGSFIVERHGGESPP